MKKPVPDPPSNATKNDERLRDRSALYRAIDFYLTGEQPSAPDELRFYNVSNDVSFEDTQLYIADLLRCASVTAYQCGDHLKGADRAWCSLSGICWKSPKPWWIGRSIAWG
jgi:hypothetical protein